MESSCRVHVSATGLLEVSGREGRSRKRGGGGDRVALVGFFTILNIMNSLVLPYFRHTLCCVTAFVMFRLHSQKFHRYLNTF